MQPHTLSVDSPCLRHEMPDPDEERQDSPYCQFQDCFSALDAMLLDVIGHLPNLIVVATS